MNLPYLSGKTPHLAYYLMYPLITPPTNLSIHIRCLLSRFIYFPLLLIVAICIIKPPDDHLGDICTSIAKIPVGRFPTLDILVPSIPSNAG